jgi:hypothetical protein
MPAVNWNCCKAERRRKRDAGVARLIAAVLLLLAGNACAGSNADTTAGAALVTSVIAVAIGGAQTVFTWRQARTQDDQRFASVWPRLSFDMSVDASDGVDGGARTARVMFGVVNKGVGPAIVRAFRVKLDGTPLSSPKALLAKTRGPDPSGTLSSIVGEVLSPGERVTLVEIHGDLEMVRPFSDVLLAKGQTGAPRLEASVCYCSVFEQCWWATRHGGEPVATPTCPHDAGVSNYHDAW